QLIEDIAKYMEIELLTPDKGYKWSISGVDGIIDNIASSKTLEVGARILKSQGRLIFPGVNTPKRCEMTPHYFKELEIVGSNAFSVEFFEGKRAHAFEFFLDFLAEKKIDTTPLVTHKFSLEQYQDAFNVMANKKESNAIKIVFDFS
ncbi:MAG: zinc-binding dehydrogenase, partial [archaeon]|nr:zinc-binding dehydrogenase [archaeon]